MSNSAADVRCTRCGASPSPAPPARGWAPTAPAPLPAPHSTTEATRYLCVAVQFDSLFAQKVIAAVLEEPHRAVASSPGVDLVCVMRYALAARSRQAAAWVLLMLTAYGLIASVVFRSALPFPTPAVVLPLLVLAWAIVLIERLTTFYGVLRPRLSRTTFDPTQAPPAARPRDEALLHRLAAQDHQGNVTVFSGYEPFLGYGRLLDSWNFTITVDRPGEQFDDVIPFSVGELLTAVTHAIQVLGLPGVDVSERVFVSGADLAQDIDPVLRQLLLPRPADRPEVTVPPAVMNRLREDGSARARTYLVTTVQGWGSELVTTSTIRFSLSPAKDLLFIEGATSLLPPIHRDYHMVDHLLDRPTWRQLLALAKESAVVMLPRLVISLAVPVAAPVAGIARWLRNREQLRLITQRAFNYGARLSVREAAINPKYHRYYQHIDRQMYTKIVERRTMDALVTFLQDHQVDVSELRERQSVIYNGGVFTSGNARINFINSPVAAGAGSRIRLPIWRVTTEKRKEKP
ncbi:hypothetical protein [Kitasatospora sp. NPDC093558]|uniref:hypothetical protein n=1 Tax=Kitasatospora sp. NPDC093558 TaxID=3155201 RepID=UPI00341C3635